MKKKVYIPMAYEIEFDFMRMEPESIQMTNNGLKMVFELKCFDPEFRNLGYILFIYFDYTDRAIDERFPNYHYIELESIHKIELSNYEAEYHFSEKFQSKILQVAKTIMPRKYTEIKQYQLV